MTVQADGGNVLSQVDGLDAAGDHYGAIALLSRAVGQGHAAAAARLGVRLLLGDRAPPLPADGLRFLAEAAEKGRAEAASLLAVLHAAGAHCAQDWTRALDYLHRAAALGDASAQGALRLLAETTNPAAGDDAAPGDRWDTLRAAIDLRALTAAPAGRPLCGDPFVCLFEDFADKRVCAWLIARARRRLVRAQVYNAVSRQTETQHVRTNSAANFGLLDIDIVQVAVQARIAAAAEAPFHHLEAPMVLHYAPGEEITEHFDFIDPRLPDHDRQVARNGQRIVTFLVYLNDDYDGGTTDFPRLSLSHKGATGQGLLFSNADASAKADLRTAHAGRPPRRNAKWIMSQFIRNRPILPGVRPSGSAAAPHG